MQHADRECVIKHSPEWQVEDVGLHNVRIRKMARGRECRFDRVAEIDADDVAGAELRGELRMTPFATAAFQHNFIFEELSIDGSNPTEKLLLITLVCLREVLPLPTEIRSRRGLVPFDFSYRREAGHAAYNRPLLAAIGTMNGPGNNLSAFKFGVPEFQRSRAIRTKQIFLESFFQAVILSIFSATVAKVDDGINSSRKSMI